MFSGIHGQDHIIDFVRKSDRADRLASTLLLSGKSGYGLWQLGHSIANYLFCPHRKEDACGVCSDCKKVRDLQHPDLHIFFPTFKSGQLCAEYMSAFRSFVKDQAYPDYSGWLEATENSTRSLNINKDIIKEILKAFSFKSFEGGPRIYLIWGAEFLDKEGNKLLKVIEEPPENCYVILMVEDRQRLLPTILSRCQTLLLKPLSNADLLEAAHLEETEENIQIIQMAGGDAHRLQSIVSHEDQNQQLQWISYLRKAFKGNPIELMDFSAEIAKGSKESTRQFIQRGLALISQMVKSKMGIPLGADPSVDKLAQLLRMEDLEAINQRLQADLIHIGRNANLRILFASQSIWLSEIFRNHKKSSARV